MIHPVAGTDYPRTFQEFDAWFCSEDNCLQYIAKLRWPKGFLFHRLMEQAVERVPSPAKSWLGGDQYNR